MGCSRPGPITDILCGRSYLTAYDVKVEKSVKKEHDGDQTVPDLYGSGDIANHCGPR